MKKQILALVLLTSLSGCNSSSPVETQTDENQIIEDQENQNHYEGTVDYLDRAEELSSIEMVEANRAYYNAAAPSGWNDYNDTSYAEHMKLYLHAWKTGTFVDTNYAGQSLVLVYQECEGPCSGAYFRYAVDESTDTWTLLVDYSSSEEGWVGGPTDARDSKVLIPELNVPKTLEAYENDSVVLLNEYSRINSDRFPESEFIPGISDLDKMEDFADDSFPTYYHQNGCVYGVAPDGVMARYTVLPNEYVTTDKEGNFDPSGFERSELTFVDNDGNSGVDTYTLFAGGCGLGWSCLDTFELTAEEEGRLEQVGTLDGRPVYLPKSIDENPAIEAGYNLDRRLLDAFNNMLMAQAYDLGVDPSEYQDENAQNIEAFLAAKTSLLIKLDNGNYILTSVSEYGPTAECGKPVIYLYPEKNTLVNVQVGIDEFTKTVPAYGAKGWTVLARPSGLLTNLADKLNYPYLFWEGLTNESVVADQTWTLRKDEVNEQLPVALMSMGLNETETADFMEFWLPKLEAVDQEYVEFAFVGNEAMNQIAPLSVKPYPDQIIRLFMYYRGTDKEGLSMPNYKPMSRHGFTLVEWGGTLY